MTHIYRRKPPTSRLGWHNYYVKAFNKTQSPQAEHLAHWYLLLALEEMEPL